MATGYSASKCENVPNDTELEMAAKKNEERGKDIDDDLETLKGVDEGRASSGLLCHSDSPDPTQGTGHYGKRKTVALKSNFEVLSGNPLDAEKEGTVVPSASSYTGQGGRPASNQEVSGHSVSYEEPPQGYQQAKEQPKQNRHGPPSDSGDVGNHVDEQTIATSQSSYDGQGGRHFSSQGSSGQYHPDPPPAQGNNSNGKVAKQRVNGQPISLVSPSSCAGSPAVTSPAVTGANCSLPVNVSCSESAVSASRVLQKHMHGAGVYNEEQMDMATAVRRRRFEPHQPPWSEMERNLGYKVMDKDGAIDLRLARTWRQWVTCCLLCREKEREVRLHPCQHWVICRRCFLDPHLGWNNGFLCPLCNCPTNGIGFSTDMKMFLIRRSDM